MNHIDASQESQEHCGQSIPAAKTTSNRLHGNSMMKSDPFQKDEADIEVWERASQDKHYQREVYEGSTALLPELRILGWLKFTKALPQGLKPARHPNTYEIHYMKRGHVQWWVRSKENSYLFSDQQTFIVKANELHGGLENSLQPCEHYWLRIQFPDTLEMPGLSRKEIGEIQSLFDSTDNPIADASADTQLFFEQLLEEHRHQYEYGSISQTMARSCLHALLITIVRAHQSVGIKKPMYSQRIKQAVDWIEEHLFDYNLKFDDYCSQRNYSINGLRARFKKETGYAPLEYIIHRRLQIARHELEHSDKSITSIAHSLGFSTSQYLATSFRQQMGLTPSEYRKRHRSANAKPAF